MPQNTIRTAKPVFGGPGSAFAPVIRKQNVSNTRLIKSRNDRTKAFLYVRSLFHSDDDKCCVVN